MLTPQLFPGLIMLYERIDIFNIYLQETYQQRNSSICSLEVVLIQVGVYILDYNFSNESHSKLY